LDPVDPQSTARFQFTISAPGNLMNCHFQWRMVHELVNWFGTSSGDRVVGIGLDQGDCARLADEIARLEATIDQLWQEMELEKDVEERERLGARMQSPGYRVNLARQHRQALGANRRDSDTA
jgi:hypothetical protein